MGDLRPIFDLGQHYSHPWLIGHTKIYMTTTFPTSAAGWTSEFVQTLFAKAGNTYNTNLISGSLSRWPVFGVTAPNLIHMPRLLDESTTFLVGFCKRPALAGGRISAHVRYSDTWGRDVPKSLTVVITNSRASPSDYSDIETEELVADALSGLPSLAGKCANLVEYFGSGVEDVPCQAPSTIYVTISINVAGESNVVKATRGMRNVNHQLRRRGLDAHSLGTDAYSVGSDAFSEGTDAFSEGTDARSLGTDANSLSTDAYSLGTDARSLGTDANSLGTDAYSLGTDAYSLGTAMSTGRAVSLGPCKHCYEYHGRWHKACEASKEEKRNGKKRRR